MLPCLIKCRTTKPRVRFLGMELQIRGLVLRPRQETELLALVAQSLLDKSAPAAVCVDVCCGTGNLALALAAHAPDVRVIACDLIADAVASARHNVEELGFREQIEVSQGDLFEPVAGLEGKVDLIVCNPPYISTSRLLSGDRAHLLLTEPREAFDGGPYGITLLTRLIVEGAGYLKSGGWLAFEFGLGQDRQVAALLKRSRAYEDAVWRVDDAGDLRVVCARKV